MTKKISKTEQDYITLAEDCKQRIADKNKIIENQESRIENLTNTCQSYAVKIDNLKVVVAHLLNAID